MPEMIINASGPQYGLVINPDGSINVSGIDLAIGSLTFNAGNVYVTSGDNMNLGSAWTGAGSVYLTNQNIYRLYYYMQHKFSHYNVFLYILYAILYIYVLFQMII